MNILKTMYAVALLSATIACSNARASSPTLPHNKTMAIAVPLSDIQIDGNLTDWPSDMPIYPVRERWVCI